MAAWVPSVGVRTEGWMWDVGPYRQAMVRDADIQWRYDPRVGVYKQHIGTSDYFQAYEIAPGNQMPWPALSVVTTFQAPTTGSSIDHYYYPVRYYLSTAGWEVGVYKPGSAGPEILFNLATDGYDTWSTVPSISLTFGEWYTVVYRYDGINKKSVDVYDEAGNLETGYITYTTGGRIRYSSTSTRYRLYQGQLGTTGSAYGPVLIYARDIGPGMSAEFGRGGPFSGNIYRPFISRHGPSVPVAPSGTFVSATSTLSLGSDASANISRNVSAENALLLSQSASTQNVLNVGGSSTLVFSQNAWGGVQLVMAENTLSLSQQASTQNVLNPTAESTLSLGQSASAIKTHWFQETASNTLSLGQSASADKIHVYTVDASSTLEMAQTVGLNTILNRDASNTLELTQTSIVGRPKYVEAENILQEVRLELDPGTLDLVEVIYGLDQSASASKILQLNVESTLDLVSTVGYSKVDVGGISVAAESVLALDQGAWITEVGAGVSVLALTQVAEAQVGKPTGSEIALAQSASAILVRARTVQSELQLNQAASYILIHASGVQLCQYAPSVGASDDPDAPEPPSTSLQGPMEGILVPFQLVYPAEGGVTDAVSLRAPQFGNKDILSFQRIQRESRGGTMAVYADPIWPKVQTLVLEFAGLYKVEAAALLEFMENHLGEEIGLIDWEHRYWRGVIITPDDPVIEDRFDQFSASFSFEGELDPTWNPQAVPPTLRISAIRSVDPQNYYQPEEPDVPEEEVTYYTGEADEAILIGQPVYTKADGHVALAQANASGVCQVSGIARNSVGATYTCQYDSDTDISQDDWTDVAGTVSLTPGMTYYLDPDTAGHITVTPPFTAGQYVVRVGRAVSATTLDIEIELPILL
jgi:hypothetical protein